MIETHPESSAFRGACPVCGADRSSQSGCASCGRERSDPKIDVVLANKYQIDALIGVGGMGRVYRATQLELNEPVAVKLLLGHWARAPEHRARFRREAIALARLRHPGIVAIMDFGEHAGDPYIVMELLRGTTLASHLRGGKAPWPIARVGDGFDQILQVLEVVHAQGIVHRDLKPENVMLLDASDRPDRVKILDFGLAHVEEPRQARLTESGAVHGTPHYMSPEQCRGREVGPPTDVYAVGVMLFQALAGALPFEGSDAAGLMAMHMFVDPPKVAEVGAKRAIGSGLEAVVRRALAKDHRERPSAAELRIALGSAIQGTDAHTLAFEAASARARVTALSRSERALTRVFQADPADGAEPESTNEPMRVVLWVPDGQRALALRNALAPNGIIATIWPAQAPPPARVDDEAIRVIVVLAQPDGASRTRAVRESAALEGIAVMAVDVLDAAQVASLIRAGASDVALATVGDQEVSNKIRRVLRRGR